jgi:hypothetical protein
MTRALHGLTCGVELHMEAVASIGCVGDAMVEGGGVALLLLLLLLLGGCCCGAGTAAAATAARGSSNVLPATTASHCVEGRVQGHAGTCGCSWGRALCSSAAGGAMQLHAHSSIIRSASPVDDSPPTLRAAAWCYRCGRGGGPRLEANLLHADPSWHPPGVTDCVLFCV